MTKDEKKDEIGWRVIRLSELRGELMIARENREKMIGDLHKAGNGNYVDDLEPMPKDGDWPTPAELRDGLSKVEDLRAKAGPYYFPTSRTRSGCWTAPVEWGLIPRPNGLFFNKF